MEFLQPTNWEDALAAKGSHPEAVPIQGGTDVMVEMNFDRHRPEVLLDLSRVRELKDWSRDNGLIRVGSGVPYAQLVRDLAQDMPGLAIAARTVGSPQIRNRGTVGGNLGAASPAGDSHPPLLASHATYVVASKARGERQVPAREFYIGPKRNCLEPDELIAAILLSPATGGQQFAKVGQRNAMVIAVCSFAVAIDRVGRKVGTGIGSAGPTPLVADEAQTFLADVLTSQDLWESPGLPDAGALEQFGRLASDAARPIDDVRGTAEYRRRAIAVMARRTAAWALAQSQ